MGGGAWLFFEKILLLGKGLILAYLYANWLSREVYGEYQFIIAFLGVVSILIFPGMGVAIVQALARGKDGIFSRAASLLFRSAFLGSGILFLSAGYYLYSEKPDLAKSLALLALVFPGYIVMNIWRYYYTGKAQFDRLVRTSIVLETISLLSTSAALLYFPQLIWLVMLGVALPIPFSLLLVWRLHMKTRDMDSDSDNIRFGRSISYTVGLSTLATYGDKLILGHFLGFSDLAVYSVALIIPEQAKGAIASFMVPLLPQYSAAGKKGELKDHFIFFAVISFAGAVTLYFLMPIFFRMVFPQYVDGILFARVLLVILLFIPFVLLETFFRSQKKERVVFRANFIGSVLGLVLAIGLVPAFGIIGAVFAKLLGQLVQGASFALSLREDSAQK